MFKLICRQIFGEDCKECNKDFVNLLTSPARYPKENLEQIQYLKNLADTKKFGTPFIVAGLLGWSCVWIIEVMKYSKNPRGKSLNSLITTANTKAQALAVTSFLLGAAYTLMKKSNFKVDLNRVDKYFKIN